MLDGLVCGEPTVLAALGIDEGGAPLTDAHTEGARPHLPEAFPLARSRSRAAPSPAQLQEN